MGRGLSLQVYTGVLKPQSHRSKEFRRLHRLTQRVCLEYRRFSPADPVDCTSRKQVCKKASQMFCKVATDGCSCFATGLYMFHLSWILAAKDSTASVACWSCLLCSLWTLFA